MSSSTNVHESDQNHSERMSAGGKAPRRKIRSYLHDDPANPRLPFQEQDALSETASPTTTIADEDMNVEVHVRPYESPISRIAFLGGQTTSSDPFLATNMTRDATTSTADDRRQLKQPWSTRPPVQNESLLRERQEASAISARGSAATTNRLEQAAPSSTAHQSERGGDVLEELIPESGLSSKRIVRSGTNGAVLHYLLECISSSGRTCGWVEADSLRHDHKVIAEFHIKDSSAEGRDWAIWALWGTKWGHILAFVRAQGL